MAQIFIHDANRLFGYYDTRIGVVDRIGRLDRVLTDVAFAPSGELFGITFSALYKVDPTSGRTTLVGRLPSSGANGLVARDDGTLVATTLSGRWIELDANGGVLATRILPLGATSAGDVNAYKSGGGSASKWVMAARGDSFLVTGDPADGARDPVLVRHGIPSLFGLAGAGDNILFGAAGARILKVDPTTGTSELVADLSSLGFRSISGASWVGPLLEKPVVFFSSVNVAQPEGDFGRTPFTFTIARTGDTSQPIDITYEVVPGGPAGLDRLPAADAADFDFASPFGSFGTVIPAGKTSASITINVAGDRKVEADEYFHLRILDANGASIDSARRQAIGSIINDDAPPHQVVFLNFNRENIYWNGMLYKGNFEVPGSSVDSSSILNRIAGFFAEFPIEFTVERPRTGPYSTIYIGGGTKDVPEDVLGGRSYAGMAERVDPGNQIKDDKALVFTSGVEENVEYLTQVVAHELGHLLGLFHVEPSHHLMHPILVGVREIGELAYRAEIDEQTGKVELWPRGRPHLQDSKHELMTNLKVDVHEFTDADTAFAFSVGKIASPIFDARVAAFNGSYKSPSFTELGHIRGEEAVKFRLDTGGAEQIVLIGRSTRSGEFDIFSTPDFDGSRAAAAAAVDKFDLAKFAVPVRGRVDGGLFEIDLVKTGKDGVKPVGLVRALASQKNEGEFVPVAADDGFVVDGAAVGKKGILLDLLGNDVPFTGRLNTKLVEVVSSFDNGTATIKKGTLLYKPDPGFEGTDTLTYTVADGSGRASDPAEVRIEVRQADASPGLPPPPPPLPPGPSGPLAAGESAGPLLTPAGSAAPAPLALADLLESDDAIGTAGPATAAPDSRTAAAPPPGPTLDTLVATTDDPAALA